jgi:hypothetical protein
MTDASKSLLLKGLLWAIGLLATSALAAAGATYARSLTTEQRVKTLEERFSEDRAENKADHKDIKDKLDRLIDRTK